MRKRGRIRLGYRLAGEGVRRSRICVKNGHVLSDGLHSLVIYLIPVVGAIMGEWRVLSRVFP
jgi:hypothetical protein